MKISMCLPDLVSQPISCLGCNPAQSFTTSVLAKSLSLAIWSGCLAVSQVSQAANDTIVNTRPTINRTTTTTDAALGSANKVTVSTSNANNTQNKALTSEPVVASNTTGTVIDTPTNPSPIVTATPVVTTQAPEKRYDTVIANGVPLPPSYPLDVPSYLTLDQAQRYLVQVSPKIAADNAAIVSNERMTDATKNLNKPVIYLDGSATHFHLADNVDTSGIRNDITNGINNGIGNIPNLPVPLPTPLPPINVGDFIPTDLPSSYPVNIDKNTSNANITVVWSAYNGGKTDAVTDLLKGRTNESKADADLSLSDQYTSLTKRYFTTQLAIMAAYLRADALNAIRETDHAAQRALDVGLISQVERLEAKSALANAEYENTKALNDAELAMTALQRLLRTPYNIKPTSPLFVSTKPIPSLAYFQDQAKRHHPGFQKVAAKYDQAKALHEFSEADYKPTVTVFGRHEIATHDANWVAGVSANWKLWGGVDRKASTQSSLAQLHQAEFSQIDVEDNILLLVEKNWQTLKNAQSNYLSLNTNIDLAKEMLRFRQLGFKEGVNTAVEVIQAEANLERAKTEQVKAANDYVQALADLMQSCGTPLQFNDYMQAADIRLPALFFEHQTK